MKVACMLAVVGLLCLPSVRAQDGFPGNPTVAPKKTATRSIGGGVNPGASIDSATRNPTVRYVTHIVLYEYRMWTNTEGKPLEAKLIAFEDLVVETPKGATEPVMPAPPAHPTVTRDGKIRLLVNKKAVEVALDKLSQSDREFNQMKAALEKKAASGCGGKEETGAPLIAGLSTDLDRVEGCSAHVSGDGVVGFPAVAQSEAPWPASSGRPGGIGHFLPFQCIGRSDGPAAASSIDPRSIVSVMARMPGDLGKPRIGNDHRVDENSQGVKATFSCRYATQC